MSRIAVGISGGVDSAVVVHLLQQAGHEVVGIHLSLTPNTALNQQTAEDARIVAEHFGIEFHVVDARESFEKNVIVPFAQAYIHGQTPNPCVRCNAYIKFGALWQEAQRLGCSHLATGHYARIEHNEAHHALKNAKDPKKDQSYFLWSIPASVLPHVLFPLGDFLKTEVRDIAATLGLPTASKRDSQEICFVPDDDYIAFLNSYCPDKLPQKGHFINEEETILGTHQGAWRYTIGQRRGLGLALGYPAYVIDLNSKNNTVTVGHDEALWHNELIANAVNFHTEASFEGDALIKIRSRDQGTMGHWSYNGEFLTVHFDQPVRAITPGQSVVLYNNSRIIGGGIILQALTTSL